MGSSARRVSWSRSSRLGSLLFGAAVAAPALLGSAAWAAPGGAAPVDAPSGSPAPGPSPLSTPAGLPDTDTSTDQASAEALFREARRLLASGDARRACALFEQSLDLRRSPGTLLNLGNCSVTQQDLVGALERFQDARSLASLEPDEQKRTAWLGAAEAQVLALGNRVPALFVVWEAGAVATVAVDDKQLPQGSGPLLLNPGWHNLRIRVGLDGQVQERRFSLEEGQRMELHVARDGRVPDEGAVPWEPAARDRSLGAERAFPKNEEIGKNVDGAYRAAGAWLLGGAAVALTAAAGVEGVAALRGSRDLALLCEPPQPGSSARLCRTEQARSTLERSERHAVLADRLALGALGSAALAAVLAWLSRAETQPAEPTLRAACDDRHCWAEWRGVF